MARRRRHEGAGRDALAQITEITEITEAASEFARFEPEIAPAHETAYAGSDVAYGPAGATPSARKVAREHGIDLSSVQGTGKHGVITSRDVVGIEPPAHEPSASTRARISPAARRLARESGLELARLAPTGGTVHLADVERAIAAPERDYRELVSLEASVRYLARRLETA